MAVFSDLTTVLLDASQPGARGRGSWVLWPVFGHRVVAPVAASKELNLFQRAVLDLIDKAGIRQATRQAELLNLSPDLTALVQEELTDMGLLERSGALSHRGSRLLEEMREARTDDPTICWLITDALSNARWSRLVPVPLPTIAPTSAEKTDRTVLLPLGTEGKPHSPRALRWEPRSQKPVPPTEQEVLELVSRRARRNRQRPQLEHISIVDTGERPFYLALRVEEGDEGPVAHDPFSGMPDRELTAWVERLEPGPDQQPTDALWNWLTGGKRRARQVESLATLQTKAEFDVCHELTMAIDNHPDEKRRLVSMQRALLEARTSDAPDDKWGDVAVKTQVALEHLIGQLLPRKKERRKQLIDVIPKNDRNAARDLFHGLAGQAGFTTPLPRTLGSVQPGKVEAALQQGQGSLRPMVLAALLEARESHDHPLHKIARREPLWLAQIDRLASLRDRVAHASSEQSSKKESGKICQKEIEDAVLFVFRAAQALLFPTREAHERTGSHHREGPRRAPAPPGASPARGASGEQA